MSSPFQIAYKHFSDAYGIGDAKIAMGILKHFGLVGIPDTGKAVQCFEEPAQRYHYSEKEQEKYAIVFLVSRPRLLAKQRFHCSRLS